MPQDLNQGSNDHFLEYSSNEKPIEAIKSELKKASGNYTKLIFIDQNDMLRDDIYEIISYAKNLGFRKIQIKTNTRSYFLDSHMSRLFDMGLTEVVPFKVYMRLGYSCNNNCLFCVQGNKGRLFNKPTHEVKAELKAIRKKTSGVVLTGGEPTLRKDIIEIVSHARDLGFTLIQVQTNGRMFRYPDFCRRIVMAGANEFGVSLHSHKHEIHDDLVSCKGAFKETVKGIRNLKKIKQVVITNSVITKQNYMFCSELAEFLCDLNVNLFQLAFPHPHGNALEHFDSVVPRLTEVNGHVCNALSVGMKMGVKSRVEGIPYCLIKGYEKHDGNFFIPPKNVLSVKNINDAKRNDKVNFVKAKKCRNCRYYMICDGIYKEYADRNGFSEINPVNGKKIKSPYEIFG